jgi:hypothetical protein
MLQEQESDLAFRERQIDTFALVALPTFNRRCSWMMIFVERVSPKPVWIWFGERRVESNAVLK